MWKISLLNLPGFVLFTKKYECFALLFQYFTSRERLILFYIIVKIFVYFFSLNTGQSWSLSWSRPFFTALAPAKKGCSGSTTLRILPYGIYQYVRYLQKLNWYRYHTWGFWQLEQRSLVQSTTQSEQKMQPQLQNIIVFWMNNNKQFRHNEQCCGYGTLTGARPYITVSFLNFDLLHCCICEAVFKVHIGTAGIHYYLWIYFSQKPKSN